MIKPVRVIPIWLCMVAAAGAVVGLAGCAGATRARGELPELRTSSDQSEPERRARLRLDLALAYFENGQNQIALDEIKIALSIYPQFGQAFNLRALIYAAMGYHELAEKNFMLATKFNPKDANLWHNQAWFYCQTNRPQEAQTFFEKSLQLSTSAESSKTWLAYGICRTKVADWANAESWLLKAYHRDSRNLLVLTNLAEVRYELLKYDLANQLLTEIKDNFGWRDAKLLWLAWRIQQKLGRIEVAKVIELELSKNFPQSSEWVLLKQGGFDVTTK
jgi:type IV pilus assembly protein PilF